jgi:hypothetical protein
MFVYNTKKQYSPTTVAAMRRAKAGGHKGAVKAIMSSHVDIEVSTLQLLTYLLGAKCVYHCKSMAVLYVFYVSCNYKMRISSHSLCVLHPCRAVPCPGSCRWRAWTS